jgi:hypothetical protein
VNIWFLVWAFLAIFIFGIFFWDVQILLRQKKAWTDFAKKHGLNVVQPKFFASPGLRGFIRGYDVSVFSELQTVNEAGTRRYRTIIQIELPSKFQTSGVIASAQARAFALSMNLPQEIKIEQAGWNQSVYLATENKELFEPFLTQERLKSFHALTSIKGVACVFIFDTNVCFLRFETPDAIEDAKKLDKLIQKILDHVVVIDPNKKTNPES